MRNLAPYTLAALLLGAPAALAQTSSPQAGMQNAPQGTMPAAPASKTPSPPQASSPTPNQAAMQSPQPGNMPAAPQGNTQTSDQGGVPSPDQGNMTGAPQGGTPKPRPVSMASGSGHMNRTHAAQPFSAKASNITPADTHSVISPRLPEPTVGADAGVRALLNNAAQALSKGQTGMADSALEDAETRILQRAVPQTQTDYSSNDPVVTQIEQARQALGNHDRNGALQTVKQILAGGSSELDD